MRKTSYGEADFLVRVLTRDFGKIDVLAKGARKSASKLNSHIDILNYIRLSFVQNGERIPTLIDAEILERNDGLFDDENIAPFALRIQKTLDIFAQKEEQQKELLSATRLCLTNISQHKSDAGAISARWLASSINMSGYGENTAFSSLPGEISERIMSLWPSLMS